MRVVFCLTFGRKAFWFPILLMLTHASHAFAADTQEDAIRAAARAAGYEGLKAFESGNLEVAVDKLGRAFNIVKVPTLGVWYARALVKTGNLVAASERYGEVIRLEIAEGKVKEQKQAQAEAADELAALKPKIPTLTLTAQGATRDCVVTVDGQPLPKQVFGLATPINPGTHRIQAKQGREVVEQSFTIAEGEHKSIDLKLDNAEAFAAARVESPAAGRQPNVAPQTNSTPTSTGSAQRTIGWISLGLGGAATATGVVTGILAIVKRKDLDGTGNCPSGACTEGEHDLVTTYNQMRHISTVGFIVGAVGLGAGATLLLTQPKPREPSMSAWVGAGAAGIRGNF